MFDAGTVPIKAVRSNFAVFSLLIMGIFFMPDYSKAATITWDAGGGNDNWSNALNWSTDTVPTSADTIEVNVSTAVAIIMDVNATVAGFNWSGGTIEENIGGEVLTVTGLINITGVYHKYLGATIDNNGSAVWTGGSIQFKSSGVFNNNVGATFDAQTDMDGIDTSDHMYTPDGESGTFNNYGTFTKSVGVGHLFKVGGSSVKLMNAGIVNVNSGIFNLVPSATHSGTFNISNGGTLDFYLSTQTMGTTSVINNTGGSVLFSGANVDFISGSTINGVVEISAGTLSGVPTIPVGSALNWSGGTVDSNAVLTVDGAMNISGHMYLDGTVENNGSAVWTGGIINFSSSDGTFNNNVGATFDAQTDDLGSDDIHNLTNCSCGNFYNYGTFTKSAGIGVINFYRNYGVRFTNDGVVNINSGTLKPSKSATHSGAFNVSSGGTLGFYTSTQTMGTTSVINNTGGGTVLFSGANVDFISGSTINGVVEMSGGTLSGVVTIPIGSTLNWNGGVLDTGAVLTVDGSLNLDGTGIYLDGTIENNGSAVWTGGIITFSSSDGTFNNNVGATFDAQTDDLGSDDIHNSTNCSCGNFYNYGTFTKSAGIGVIDFYRNYGVRFTNDGVVNVNSGTLKPRLSATHSGAFNVAGGALLHLYVGTHTLTSTSSVSGAGDVKFSTTVNFDGSFSTGGDFTNSYVLNIDIDGTTPLVNYPQINMVGTAVLSGTFNVTFINSFDASYGDSFAVMNYGANSGTFSTVNLPSLDPDLWWDVQYGPTGLVLAVAENTPPVTDASVLGGTYGVVQSVTLTCDDGAGSGCDTTYYTTDGATPTVDSSVYSAPIDISVNTTLKFLSIDNNGNLETANTEVYVIDITPPVTSATPPGGSYISAKSVTLDCTDVGGTGCNGIYYTVDGSEPSTASSVYTVPLNMAATTTLQFFAVDVIGNVEAVNTEVYSIEPVTLGDALDNTDLTWTTGGDSNWVAADTGPYNGLSSAENGDIIDSETSWIETTVTGPGTLDFYWKVSSESGYDYMTFYIDDVEQAGKISGTVGWTQRIESISSGVHTIKWAYTKDSSVSSGLDAGGLDFVVYNEEVPPVGSILINNNDATTADPNVVLTVTCDDGAGSGCLDMHFSDDGIGWSGWEPYSSSKPYTLPAGDGPKTVYVEFRDTLGNISTPYSDDIELGSSGAITPNDLIVEFGSGVGLWGYFNDTSWSKLSSSLSEGSVVGDINGAGSGDLIVDFGSAGMWALYDNGAWSKISSNNAEGMVIGNFDGNSTLDVMVDFGAAGVWGYFDDNFWTKVSSSNAEGMVTADIDGSGIDDLVVDFGALGMWTMYNNSFWTKVSSSNAEGMVSVDLNGNLARDVVVDFGPVGIWAFYDNSSWAKLSSTNPDAMASGNMNGTGTDEVIFDYGAIGLWVYYDNASWSKVSSSDPDHIATGDLNSNGFADLIVSFPGVGTWVKYDDGSWTKISGGNPLGMATGDIDGN